MTAPTDGSGSSKDDHRRGGKPRGRYKLYESDLQAGTAQTPRQTVYSRNLRAQQLQQRQERGGDPQSDVQPELNVGPTVATPEEETNVSINVPQQDPQEEIRDEQVICVGICVCGKCGDVNCDVIEGANVGPQADVGCENQDVNGYLWMNEAIFPGIPTTKFEAFLLIFHLCMRHGFTGPLVTDLLQLVNALFGCNVIPASEYIFKKLFSPKHLLQYHFYCPHCELYLSERRDCVDNLVTCNSCESEFSTAHLNDYEGNYFVTLSVKHQIEELLRKPGIKIVPHVGRPTDAIRDFMDGKSCRELCEPGKPLSNPHSLTITFNTDGAPVWNSSKGSIWPLQFLVNEVSPDQRFHPENVLLAGLWFGKGTPNMSVFLTPFIAELKDLAGIGVERVMCDGRNIQCPVLAVACTVDAVAKPKIQAIKQFNGHFGCGFCYHPNPPVPEAGGKGRYIADRAYPYRTHTEMVEDMYTANTLRESGLLKRVKGTAVRDEVWDDVNGLKGISCLLDLPWFDSVFGYMADYMHSALAGVASKFGELFFDSPQDCPFSLAKFIPLIDVRMKAITPPQSMSRPPRAVSEKNNWKCVEWRSFLLFFGLPCLHDLLPQKYLHNLTNLVKGIFILLKDCITPLDLAEADELLQTFVVVYNKLYGNQHMVYNIHQCTHLAHMVELWGPLWATATFPFESGNGALLKLIQGTRGVITQITEKYAAVQSLPNYVQNFNVSHRITEICSNICSYSPLQKSNEFGEVTALGGERCEPLSEHESEAFAKSGVPLPHGLLTYYNRVVRKGIVYYSKAYTRPKTFNDTCVQLECGRHAVIQKILPYPYDVELWALVNPLRLSEDAHLAPHIKTCALDLFAPIELIQFQKIVRKCMFVQVGDWSYVCEIRNMYERN